jgi:hypothetical protein
MSEDTRQDAVSRLLVAGYGLTTEQVLVLPDGAPERLAAGRIADREFENAVKDFITIVATTDCIPIGEERFRVALIAAVQTIWAREWTTASTGSDAQFEALRRGVKPWVFQLLALLRATRRPESDTEAGRWFMMHGVPYPTRYREARHQELFESVFRLAREEH